MRDGAKVYPATLRREAQRWVIEVFFKPQATIADAARGVWRDGNPEVEWF
jgi:hypothetical protein